MASSAAEPLTLQHSLQGHHSHIYDLSFSSVHSHVLASASADNTVALWDTTKGERLHRLHGHQNWVQSVSFEPNSHVLASGSGDRTVRLWDAQTGQDARSLPAHASCVESVRFGPPCSPAGTLLAVGLRNGRVSIWDKRAKRCMRKVRGAGEGTVLDLGFSRDGALLGLGLFMGGDWKAGPGRLEVWDSRTWSRVQQWETERAVNSVSFASLGSGLNSSVLAAGIWSQSSNIEVYDAGTGELVHSVPGHRDRLRSVQFSPDKEVLVAASDRTMGLWDCGTWTEMQQLSPFAEGETPLSAGFSMEGSTLAVGGSHGSLKIWDTSRFKQSLSSGHPSKATWSKWGWGSNRETRAASLARPEQASSSSAEMALSDSKKQSKVSGKQGPRTDIGAVPRQVAPVLVADAAVSREMLSALAPDFGGAGLSVSAFGAVAIIDPTKTAPALGALLRSMHEQCGRVLVCKVQAQGLKDTLATLQPFVDKFGEAARQSTTEGIVRDLLPGLLRVFQVMHAANMLLQDLPKDKTHIIRILRKLFTASELVSKFRGIREELSLALLNLQSCILLAHVTPSSTAAETVAAREAGGRDRRELAQQLLTAFDGDMAAFKAELNASGWDMQQLSAALQVMGADAECIKGEAEATTELQQAEIRDIQIKAKTATPAELAAIIPFSIHPSEVHVDRDASLGAGAFGKVYRGTYKGELVAVKVCLSKSFDRAQRQRVLKEAYIMHKCSAWPGIVKLHGVVVVPEGENDLHLAMVTQLVHGSTLSELIHDELEDIAPAQQLKWCLQAARAVQYLHLYPAPHGPVVHGDLKPSNMMVCEERKELKLIDFGCATMQLVTGNYAKTTVSTAEALPAVRTEYTPGYAAPEILQSIRSKKFVERNPRTDVFALGVVFYEILVRRVPFSDRCMSTGEVDAAVCEGERPATDVKELASFARVTHLIERCWHQDPEQRPSMRDICFELEECLIELKD